MVGDSKKEPLHLRPHEGQATSQLSELVGVQDVARLLGVGERYVYRLVSERRIPYIKCGHYVRFDPDEIGSWLDDARVRPTVAESMRRRRP